MEMVDIANLVPRNARNPGNANEAIFHLHIHNIAVREPVVVNAINRNTFQMMSVAPRGDN